MSNKVSRAVWAAKFEDPQAKLVLLKLADCADENGICWPSIATIAGETGLSESTVHRRLKALEELTWIIRERTKNGVIYTVKLEGTRVSHRQGLSHERGVTQTGVLNGKGCHTDSQGVSHRQLRGVTQTVTINREPPMNHHRTTTPEKTDSEKSQMALKIVEAYPRREKVALALTIVRNDLNDGESFEEIFSKTKAIASVIRSLPSGASNRYVPSAETFFRDKRWQDDPGSFSRIDSNHDQQPTKKRGLSSNDVGI